MAKGSGSAGRRGSARPKVMYGLWTSSGETPDVFLRAHGVKATFDEDWGEVSIPISEIEAPATLNIDGRPISGAVTKNGLFLPGKFDDIYFKDSTSFAWNRWDDGIRGGYRYLAADVKKTRYIVSVHGERWYSNDTKFLRSIVASNDVIDKWRWP